MKVKICSLRSISFQEDFINSIISTGFAVITHHGIDFDKIRDAQSAWRLFFLNSASYKSEFKNLSDENLGYKGFKTEVAVGTTLPDLKEFYHWKPGEIIPSEVESVTTSLFYQLEDLSGQLLKALSKEYSKFNPACDFYRDCENSENTILRALYYPALDFSKEKGAVRAAAHEDINYITLLVAASSPGLQVMDKNGSWFDVPHEENSIVVNVGDMLQLATKGYFKSTTHRVINPEKSSSDRISMPLFVHPTGSTKLSEYKTAHQFLDERLNQIYTDRK